MATFHQKNFLDQFDQPIRKYIIEYCKKLSEKEYDVYILLARKAACFLTALEDLGFICFNGIVVSDRILEYNTCWLKDKKVAIIDDTIISGTSICKIIEKLKHIGIASISVHAFCIDDFWIVDDMLRDNEHDYLLQPYMRVNHSSCIRFCRQIVEALSIIPRPYNIDFPVYEIGKLSRKQFSMILEDDNWKVVDTSTKLQNDYNVGCVSLNFKRELLSLFKESLGFDISQVLFIKLRLFTKELFDNGDPKQSRYLCKLVPYVIFNPIRSNLVQKFIGTICESENISQDDILKELRTDSAKLFFIQYYFAARVVKWWIAYTEDLINKKFSENINERSLFLLFPPSIVSKVKEFIYNKRLYIDIDKYGNDILCHQSKLSDSHAPINPLEIKAKLTNQFLNLYYKKELPARQIAKGKGKEGFKDKSYQEIMNRLDNGISLDTLKDEISSSVSDATDRNLILSTFLDNAIDRGIIVPITSIKNQYVYRGFRHGEEVIWGDANDKLLAHFFEGFAGESAVIPKFWFEKILVIFLKIGLKLNFLSEYDQTTPENQTVSLIGVRSYLYGQVSIAYEIKPYGEINFNPILDSDVKSYWTTRRLQDFGLIHLVDNQSGYRLDFKHLMKKSGLDTSEVDIDLDQSHVNKALDLAEVLKLCRDSKLLNASGLVILTSCLSLHDNTASIGAELQIYSDQIQSYINRITGALKFRTCNIEFLSSLRDAKKNILWTAINSGKDKYLKFKQGKGVDLVNEINKQLSLQSSFAARRWNEYWRKDLELLKSQDDELNELNDRMGLILIDIQMTIICIHLLMFEIAKRENNYNEFVRLQKEQLFSIDEELKQLKANHAQQDDAGLEGKLIQLNTKKNGILKSLKYWNDYVADNISTLTANLANISQQYKSRLICTDFVENILDKGYQGKEETILYETTEETVQKLMILRNNALEALKDFSALVPQWGKIRKTVRYMSFLHLNTNSKDHTYREKIGHIIKAEVSNFELDEFDNVKNDKSIVLLKVDEIKTGGRGYVLGAKGLRHDERLIKLACKILSRCKNLDEHIVITLCPYFTPEGYKAFYNPQTRLFDTVKEDLYSLLPKNEEEDCINVFVPNNKIYDDYAYPILMKYSLNKEFNAHIISKTNEIIRYKITMKQKKKIFISYSRKDVDYKEELKKHLSIIGQVEIVDIWSCEQIMIGKWDEQIQKHLKESDLIIYMLSANFFTSPYILEQEVMKVMECGPKQDVLCVIVSSFADLNKIEDYISSILGTIADKQRAILALKEFQYLPYGKIENPVTGQREEVIVPLKDYTVQTGSSIEQAFSQIANKVIDFFKNKGC